MSLLTSIKEQFDKVIRYSQLIENPQTDELFKTWYAKKQDIISAFKGKYIYEYPKPVTFELNEKARQSRVDSFISELYNQGFDELADFVDYEREGFFENKIIRERNVILYDKSTTITKNTKLVKSFKYFIEDKDILNDLQIKASQIIQENKVTGTLCFSVHPLDYLSISENTHNWRSCHALDGEYRAGNLSYMLDEHTIVCYLKSEDDVKLPHFPEDVLWNNKKWRVLLYLSNDWNMIFAGKQYPFTSESGMEFILNKCFNNHTNLTTISYSNNKTWSNWTDFSISEYENNDIHCYFNNNYIPLNGGMVALTDLVQDEEGSKQFNDVLKSSCYIPIYTTLIKTDAYSDYKYPLAHYKKTHFKIGGMTKCLRCGEKEIYDSADTMMCYDCELKYGNSVNDAFGFCENCNCRMIVDDGYWLEDGVYCSDCFDEVADKCINCGEYYLLEHMEEDRHGNLLCKYCYDDLREE